MFLRLGFLKARTLKAKLLVMGARNNARFAANPAKTENRDRVSACSRRGCGGFTAFPAYWITTIPRHADEPALEGVAAKNETSGAATGIRQENPHCQTAD